MPYPEYLIAPMREELTRLGCRRTRSRRRRGRGHDETAAPYDRRQLRVRMRRGSCPTGHCPGAARAARPDRVTTVSSPAPTSRPPSAAPLFHGHSAFVAVGGAAEGRAAALHAGAPADRGACPPRRLRPSSSRPSTRSAPGRRPQSRAPATVHRSPGRRRRTALRRSGPFSSASRAAVMVSSRRARRRSPASRAGRSLDVFRGATMAAMVIVNNPGDWGNIYWPLGHAPWDGWTPTDLIFPYFLFIVGVAITLSRKTSSPSAIVRRSATLDCARPDSSAGSRGSTWRRPHSRGAPAHRPVLSRDRLCVSVGAGDPTPRPGPTMAVAARLAGLGRDPAGGLLAPAARVPWRVGHRFDLTRGGQYRLDLDRSCSDATPGSRPGIPRAC